jgi:hypothetical protein
MESQKPENGPKSKLVKFSNDNFWPLLISAFNIAILAGNYAMNKTYKSNSVQIREGYRNIAVEWENIAVECAKVRNELLHISEETSASLTQCTEELRNLTVQDEQRKTNINQVREWAKNPAGLDIDLTVDTFCHPELKEIIRENKWKFFRIISDKRGVHFQGTIDPKKSAP